MIVKFDHITYAASLDKHPLIENMKNDYNVLFRCSAENLDIKKNLMTSYDSTHELVLFEPKNKDYLPIEFTFYNQTFKRDFPAIEHYNNNIIIYTKDKKRSTDFFLDLGFKDKETHMEFTSFFAPKEVVLQFKPDKTITSDWLLDSEKWCGMAFMSTNAHNEHERLCKKYYCTEVRELLVNNKTLDLFFVKGNLGECIEIFSVRNL